MRLSINISPEWTSELHRLGTTLAVRRELGDETEKEDGDLEIGEHR